MSIEVYLGYFAEGFASPNGEGGYEAHGRVCLGQRIVRESGALGHYANSETAQYRGLLWARKLIETLPSSSLM